MFPYVDPGKTLKPAKALANYRLVLHTEYFRAARTLGSAFTLLEAFQEVPPSKVQTASVDWAAFPRSAPVGNNEIDADRFRWQDEYVEWRVETNRGRIARITFTTDFLAYFEPLARVGLAELQTAVSSVIPGATPTAAELFGSGFRPASASEDARGVQFRRFAQRNPWINGRKGILCLAHGSSTLGALVSLVDAAALPNKSVAVGDICGTLDGNCVPTRNSDPSIASAVQTVARGGNSLTLADPIGVEIARLAGIWRVGDRVININDSAGNDGIWHMTRSGRRAVLEVGSGLLLDDSPITSGAQVAAALRVKATVLLAADADLPEWARAGQENSQRLLQVVNGGNQ